MERSRNRYQLLTRWDDKKIDAYADYVDAVKAKIAMAVRLYEFREGMRQEERTERELRDDLADASLTWGRSFERVMLLGGDDAIEAAHELNVVLAEINLTGFKGCTGLLALDLSPCGTTVARG
ncbi:hypothetical protein [Streptomyces sp. BPTC-684]|uniref:hypothetical protein n=1 Tax=Streptomyces sp. BPTC-684 TaxID=3043734 RepID=UPI0024B102AA|nr:hypothetical protein [Streptomyces sp. BPTC-684]WHM37425.1 hypothetical protein QIY60_11260 [Streptomyces sp. BPTC-684]